MAYDMGLKIGVEGEESFSAALKRINANLASQRAQMRAIQKTYDDNDQSVEKLTRQGELLNRQIETQLQKLLLLQRRMQDARDEYGESAVETEKWREKVNAAAAQLDQLSSELDRNNTALQDAQRGTDQLAEEQQRAVLAAEQLRKAELEAADAIAKSSEKLQRAAESMQAINRAAMVTAAGAAAVTVAISKVGIDFEDAFAGVAKTVDATDAQLAELKAGIRDLATQMPTAATEIAGVAEAAGQLGIAADDILGFTETMVMLGDTTNLTAEEAASALAKFANIAGTSADNYDRLGAVIVDLGNNFATTEADIVAMSTRLASAGTMAGLTEAEIMALAAAMSSVGIEAEAGGTAMTQTLAAMESAAAQGGQSLQQFADVAGVSAAEFKRLWSTDTITALRKFIAGLGKLEEKGESAVLVLDEMGLSGVRQSNMLQSLALASDTLGGAIDTANNAWKDNTALTKEAAKRYETTASKLSMLKNAAADTGIALYSKFARPLNDAIGALTDRIAGFADQLESGRLDGALSAIGTAAATAATGIVAMNGVMAAKDLANFAQAVKLGGAALANYTAATKAGAIAQGALNLAQAVSPMGLVAASASAAAVGLGMYLEKTVYAESAVGKFDSSLNDLNDRLDANAKAQQKMADIRAENVAAVESEISQTQAYVRELRRITDENGRVNAGYEARADYLMQQINSIIPNAISKNEDEAGSIYAINDALEAQIVAKRKSALLDAMQDEYSAALENRVEAQNAYTAAILAQGDAQRELNRLDEQYNELLRAQTELANNADPYASIELSSGLVVNLANLGQELQNVADQQEIWRQKLEETAPIMQEAQTNLDQINQTINNFDAVTAAESMQQLDIAVAGLSANIVKFTGENQAAVAQAVVETQLSYDRMVITVAKGWDEMSAEQQASATSMLAALKTNLDQQVVEAHNGGYEIAAATGDGMAQGSYVYTGELAEMLAEGQAKMEAAGIDVLGIGADYAANYGEGIQSNIGEILGIVGDMTGDASAELQRTEGEANTSGSNFGLGYASGIRRHIQGVIDAAAAIGAAAVSALNRAQQSHSPSRLTMQSGLYFDLGYAKGIDDNADKAEDAAAKMSKKILTAANDWLDDQKYYNRLALGDEVEFWTQMLSVTELQAGEVAEVQKKLYAAKANASKASLDQSKQWIAQEKYYNRLSAEEELAAWERVVSRKNLLLSEQMEAEKQLYAARANASKASLDQSKQWIAQEKYYNRLSAEEELAAWREIVSRKNLLAAEQLEAEKQLYAVQQQIINEYTSNLDARVNALGSYAGIFDKINAENEISGQDLLQNLRDQITVFEDWQSDIEGLADKGVTGALLEELQKLGPAAAQEIDALNDLTAQQLEEYAALFEKKAQLIQDQAIKELGEVPIKFEAQTEAGAQMITDITAGMTHAAPQLQEAAEEITEATNTLIGSYQDDLRHTGLQLMESVAQGILDGKIGVISAVENVLWSAVDTARDAVQINTPSADLAQELDVGWRQRMQQVARDINDSIPAPDTENRRTAAERMGESIVNGVAAVAMGNPQPVVVQVQLRDKTIAEAIYDPLKQVGRQRGY